MEDGPGGFGDLNLFESCGGGFVARYRDVVVEFVFAIEVGAEAEHAGGFAAGLGDDQVVGGAG